MSTLLKLLLPIIMQVVENLLTEENIKKYGKKLFALLREFIADSETEWDDKTLLPVLDLFEKGLGFDD